MIDAHNTIEARRAISPMRQTNSDSAIDSQIIDMAGFDSCEFILAVGNLTDADATAAVTIAESAASDLSGSNSVAAADLYGSLPSIAAASDDNKVYKIGYRGSKRYVRLTVTPTGNNSGNFDVSCVAVLCKPQKMPTA